MAKSYKSTNANEKAQVARRKKVERSRAASNKRTNAKIKKIFSILMK